MVGNHIPYADEGKVVSKEEAEALRSGAKKGKEESKTVYGKGHADFSILASDEEDGK